MIGETDAREACAAAIEAALKAGADTADAVAQAESSESVTVRLGQLEEVERSESERLALRVFAGKRSASVSTTSLAGADLAELAEQALAIARAAPEDPYAGIAPAELLATEPHPAIDRGDEAEPGPDGLRERALAAEDAARAIKGVTNSEGGGAAYSRSLVALATSAGFLGSYSGNVHSISAMVIAGEGATMQRDYEYRVARRLAAMPDPEEIGRVAGERAVARLNPGRLKSGRMPVVFDPRVGGSLIDHLLAAMSGPSIARQGSFLVGKLEEELFPRAIRIVEDPHLEGGLRSRPFDGEGLPTAARSLVENGRLTGWLTNLAAARQLGIAPTGHAARGGGGSPGVAASNVECEAGTITPEAMIAEIEDGVFVHELIGQGVNPVTGDYSRGASGFRIRNGKLAEPVSEFTIAGNLLPMFASLAAADDLERKRSLNVPTLRVDGMSVAGD